MKKYKSLITGSLLAALIIATPVVSFAENNNKDQNNNGNKIEQTDNEKNNENEGRKNQKDNSWFGSSWFNSHNTKDTTAPVISNVVATLSNNVKKAKISWTTDVKANSIVWYSTTSPVDTSVKGMTTMKRNSRTLNHKIELKRLLPNTKYYVVVGSTNGIGKTLSTEISFTTPAITVTPIVTPPVVDVTVPVISNIETRTSGSNVEILWKTDEATSSTMFYSIVTPVDTTSTNILKIVNTTFTKEHKVSIPNLTSNTLYHFILKSVDASSNVVSSNELSFRTN
ncbi:MAG: fibronectin type III domain-containing protein [Candidatus Paceibacterota bacterium]